MSIKQQLHGVGHPNVPELHRLTLGGEKFDYLLESDGILEVTESDVNKAGTHTHMPDLIQCGGVAEERVGDSEHISSCEVCGCCQVIDGYTQCTSHAIH